MFTQTSAVELDSSNSSDAEKLSIKFDLVLQEVSDTIAPVWPLKDYVAVNPYFGLADRGFMSARAFLRVFSACETLMPIGYYAAEYRAGHLTQADVAQALGEIDWPSTLQPVDAKHIVQLLEQTKPDESTMDASAAEREQPIRTVADHATSISTVNYREIIIDEISKFCAAHYDEGQASWGSSWKHLPLYEAWRETAQIDRNVEVLGLTRMREIVASLSDDPKAALVDLLVRMQVPFPLWSTVLLSQVFSLPGWCAWAKYQDQQCTDAEAPQTLCGLLAMRLAYDYAVGKTLGLAIDWKSYVHNGCVSFQCENDGSRAEAWIRYTLLCATEVHYRRNLLQSLKLGHESKPTTSLAQMVFCIDVRSERIRRHVENQPLAIETMGFAGFFGAPMEYLALGESQATPQLPVLLKPQFCIHECVPHATAAEECQVVERRIKTRTWRKLWQTFKSSSIGSFGFVESSGLWAGWQLVSQMFRVGARTQHQADGLRMADHGLRPNVNDNAGLSLQQQIDLAARVLGNLGLTKNFARMIVFCGHQSQTNNNPLAAGLDCGACGGHSGAPNARWLALVLNKTDVRVGLSERGIMIPPVTHFAAAAHNTTTDEIEFFDQEDVPQSHQADLASLRDACRKASFAAANERLQPSERATAKEALRRATDWSEIRPEWGLAGNAAFVVGPRTLTRGLDLNAQTFLHSYDSSLDPSGAVLETIMTAPMIVANWINMQYYASTVDNLHFGSGSKAIHNVVGKFGILSGNSGDLQTGLPLQSLHDGVRFQHKPRRLLVVICAPRANIERVYQKHELVANLVNNHWLSIVAIEEQGRFKLCSNGCWQEVG